MSYFFLNSFFVMQASHYVEVDPRWALEYVCPFGSSFENCLACQRFPEDSRSWCRCRRNTTGVHTMPYNALTNGPAFSQWFYNVFMITSKLRDSVRPALICPHKRPKVPNVHIHVSIGDLPRHSVRPALLFDCKYKIAFIYFFKTLSTS